MMRKLLTFVMVFVMICISAFAEGGTAATLMDIPLTTEFSNNMGIVPEMWADEEYAPHVAALLYTDYINAYGAVPGTAVQGASIIVTTIDGIVTVAAYIYLDNGQTVFVIDNVNAGMTFVVMATLEVLADKEPSPELYEAAHEVMTANYPDCKNCYISGDVLAELIAVPDTDITGTWTAQLADAVATMELNADGSAELVISPNVYSFTWSLNGTSLILDQNGIELPAEYNGTTISLPLGNDVLVFTRSGAQVDADITGTWTAQLTDAVATMELNADGSAELVISPNVYSFTWSLNGTSLILDQNGVELPAEYNGASIMLPLGTATLEFTR